jgi:hypothetical protein
MPKAAIASWMFAVISTVPSAASLAHLAAVLGSYGIAKRSASFRIPYQRGTYGKALLVPLSRPQSLPALSQPRFLQQRHLRFVFCQKAKKASVRGWMLSTQYHSRRRQ